VQSHHELSDGASALGWEALDRWGDDVARIAIPSGRDPAGEAAFLEIRRRLIAEGTHSTEGSPRRASSS
jgi:hypothetical protein